MAQGVGGGVGFVVRADLQVDVGDAALHRARGEGECPGYVVVTPACSQQSQHLCSRGESTVGRTGIRAVRHVVSTACVASV